jgi:hypothetical protein
MSEEGSGCQHNNEIGRVLLYLRKYSGLYVLDGLELNK